MSIQHKIKFYPVDNADTSLVKLSDNTTIIIDCQFRQGEENSNGIKIFPVKDDVLNEIEKKDDNPFIDLFILSHPHKDHCLGFDDNFYTGDPNKYEKKNRDNEEIIIAELWVTQKIFGDDLIDEAKPIKKEAKRRKKMFEKKETGWDSYGNRIRIVGYNSEDETVDGLHYAPGQEINEINGKSLNLFSFFIHAPFKSDLVQSSADENENIASIVVQAIFKTERDGEVRTRAMFGGDSDHYVWEKILEKSEKNNNHDNLKWNLFLAPHHCSWSFFNDRPYDDNNEPKESSIKVLDYAEKNSHVISSSVKVENKKPNPPHYPAKNEYEKRVGQSGFKNTAINYSEKEPKPLIYIIDSNGHTLKKAIAGAGMSITQKPYRVG